VQVCRKHALQDWLWSCGAASQEQVITVGEMSSSGGTQPVQDGAAEINWDLVVERGVVSAVCCQCVQLHCAL